VPAVANRQEVVRETGAAKVSLVGWSWGGVVAPMVAIERPDLVDRMVLLGAMRAFVLPMMTDPFAVKGDPDNLRADARPLSATRGRTGTRTLADDASWLDGIGRRGDHGKGPSVGRALWPHRSCRHSESGRSPDGPSGRPLRDPAWPAGL